MTKPNLLVRLIALLLVPCLLADPALALSIRSSVGVMNSPAAPLTSSSVYSEQAMMLRPAEFASSGRPTISLWHLTGTLLLSASVGAFALHFAPPTDGLHMAGLGLFSMTSRVILWCASSAVALYVAVRPWINRYSYPILELLRPVREGFHWRGDLHTRAVRFHAIDWSINNYLASYQMDWRPEFLLPKPSLRTALKHLRSDAEEILFGLSCEIVLHLPLGGLLKFMKDRLQNKVREKWLRHMTQDLQSDDAQDIIDDAGRSLDEANSIEEKNRLFKGYFRRSGYLWSDHLMKEFKNLPTGTDFNSTSDRVSPREKRIQVLEGYLQEIMRWKRGTIKEKKDREILRFLRERLYDEDPWVAKAALRAIGASAAYLETEDKKAILQIYYDFLRHHPSDIVRGSVARDLSQGLVSDENLGVIRRALESGRQSPWVQAYLAESFEYLLEKTHRDPEDFRYQLDHDARFLLNLAENPDSIIALRVNSVRALGRLGRLNDHQIGRLRQIFLTDPDPSVQEAALWSLARICSSPDSAHFDPFLQLLIQYVKEGAGERQNPLLERVAKTLLDRLSPLSTNEGIKTQARQAISRLSVKAINSLVYIDVSSIAANGGSGSGLSNEQVSALLRHLHERKVSIVPTDGFREDRDKSRESEPMRPAMRLRTDLMRQALDNLRNNLPARVPSRDPMRGKSARRMERVVVPIENQPVVIFGRGTDARAISQTCGMPIPVISLGDFMDGVNGTVNYDKLFDRLNTVSQEALIAQNESYSYPWRWGILLEEVFRGIGFLLLVAVLHPMSWTQLALSLFVSSAAITGLFAGSHFGKDWRSGFKTRFVVAFYLQWLTLTFQWVKAYRVHLWNNEGVEMRRSGKSIHILPRELRNLPVYIKSRMGQYLLSLKKLPDPAANSDETTLYQSNRPMKSMVDDAKLPIQPFQLQPRRAIYPGGLDYRIFDLFPNLDTAYYVNTRPFRVPFEVSTLSFQPDVTYVRDVGLEDRMYYGDEALEAMKKAYIHQSEKDFISNSLQVDIIYGAVGDKKISDLKPQIGLEPLIRAELEHRGANVIQVRELTPRSWPIFQIDFQDPSGKMRHLIYTQTDAYSSDYGEDAEADLKNQTIDLIFIKAFTPRTHPNKTPPLPYRLFCQRSGVLYVAEDQPQYHGGYGIENYVDLAKNFLMIGILGGPQTPWDRLGHIFRKEPHTEAPAGSLLVYQYQPPAAKMRKRQPPTGQTGKTVLTGAPSLPLFPEENDFNQKHFVSQSYMDRRYGRRVGNIMGGLLSLLMAASLWLHGSIATKPYGIKLTTQAA